MAAARRRTHERREPVLDDGEAERASEKPSESARRTAPRSERRSEGRAAKAASDEATARRKSESKPRRKARSRGRGGRGGRGGGRSTVRSLVYWGAVAALWCVIAAVGVVAWVGSHLPPIHSLEIPKRPPSVQVVGLGGKLLATRGDMGGAAIPLAEMPPHLPKAFIAVEDRRFYSHHGIDPVGLVRAVVANVLHKGISQGGSTLTQQLAKNLWLSTERTLWRKAEEAALAVKLERSLGKKRILALYLNVVEWGDGVFGAEAAARRWFGVPASQLSAAEAVVLASMLPAPRRASLPAAPRWLAERSRRLLDRMQSAGRIDAEEHARAAAELERILAGPEEGGEEPPEEEPPTPVPPELEPDPGDRPP
jgi:penicillin-binding protein 1A